MATSLLTAEGGPASIPVEFVQTSCHQQVQSAESYQSAPSTPQKPTTNVATIAYPTTAITATQQQLQQQQKGAPVNNNETDLNGSLGRTDPQTLRHGVSNVNVATAQSLGSGVNSQQQHSAGVSVMRELCL